MTQSTGPGQQPRQPPEKRLGGVLSGEDIRDEIKKRSLLFLEEGDLTECEKGIRGDCYDFRIGYVIGKRFGVKSYEEDKAVTLEPGEMVTLLSREWVQLPANVQALVIPRDKSAKRGILVLNAGHIDPRYSGQITAQVANLSAQERLVHLDDFDRGVFSVVFSYLTTETQLNPKVKQESTQKRLAELQDAVGEQQATLVVAESIMKERFVPRDRFSMLLWTNMIAFLFVLAAIVGILAVTNTITVGSLELAVKARWISIVVILVGLTVVHGFLSPLVQYLLRRFWPWWQTKVSR